MHAGPSTNNISTIVGGVIGGSIFVVLLALLMMLLVLLIIKLPRKQRGWCHIASSPGPGIQTTGNVAIEFH